MFFKKLPKLVLPKTLRLPRKDEVPKNSEVQRRLKSFKNANVVEGYRILPNDDDHSNELAFNFFAEININNSRLWELFLDLSNELPAEVALIFNQLDAEPHYGVYQDRLETIEFLKQYKEEIISDTFLELGLIFHDDDQLIEVFICDCKYIKFWGVDEESFRKVMNRFGLSKVNGIEYIDEYPRIRETLSDLDDQVISTYDLISHLKENFC